MPNLYIQCTNFRVMKGNQQFLSCSLQPNIAIQLLVFKVKVYILPRLWHSHAVLEITVPIQAANNLSPPPLSKATSY